jgi:hypothetical protein
MLSVLSADEEEADDIAREEEDPEATPGTARDDYGEVNRNSVLMERWLWVRKRRGLADHDQQRGPIQVVSKINRGLLLLCTPDSTLDNLTKPKYV